MVFRLLRILVLIVLTIKVEAQSEDNYNYLYASPNAAELGKYGLVPVNMSTGAMTTNVPLYSLKAGKLNVPISLSYSSTGVRVDQTASQVGLNWSLNAGGVITRIVRDKPDKNIFGSPEYPYPSNTYTMNFELARYLDGAEEDGFDSERDLFSFNFLDFTGKLIFDYSGKPLFVPHRNMEVNHIVNLLGGTVDFVLIDELGIRYFFEAGETSRTIPSGTDCGKNFELTQETAWYLTRIIHPQGDEVVFEYDWHSFTYYSGVSQSSTGLISNLGGCGTTPCSTIPDRLCQTLVFTNTARLKRILTNGHGDVNFHYSKGRLDVYDDYKLDSIEYVLPDSTILNSWKLGYVFSNNSGYGNPAVTGDGLNSRMFLTSVIQASGSANQDIRYAFEYDDMNGLPTRLSFSQDHWGYFNGKINSHLFPKYGIVAPRNQSDQILFDGKGGNREPDANFARKGLLKKIIYPTGGYSTIDYEANTYWGPKMIYPSTVIFQSNVESHTLGGPGTALVDTLFSAVNQDAMVNFTVLYLEGAFEDPIHSFGRISIRDISTNHYIVENLQVAPGNSHNRSYLLDPGKYYEVTVRAFGLGVRAVTNILHYNLAPQLVDGNYVAGGMRVARIVNHDPQLNRKDTTRYYYAFAHDFQRSSGIVSEIGTYEEYSTTQIPCMVSAGGLTVCEPVPCYYVSVSSNTSINLNNFSGNHIAYGSVILSQGNNLDNGFEEHQFLISADISGRIVHGDGRVGLPQTSSSWGNGLTKRITKFRKVNNQFVPIYKLDNTYKKDSRVNDYVPSMVVKSKYDDEVCMITPSTLVCTACDLTKKLRVRYCIANHTHKYKWIDPVSSSCGTSTSGYECLKSDNQDEYYTVNHPCFGLNEGDSVYIESAIANLDAIEYRDYVHWFYLESSVETTYAEAGDSVVVVRYNEYANAEHLQITGERTTVSDGSAVSTHYWYADDYTNVPITDSLKQNHIIAQPIKRQQYRNQKIISGEIVLFNPNGSAAEIWKLREEVPSDSVAHNGQNLLQPNYVKEGSIVHEIGKPREVHYPDGKVATLIWSYSRNYLVAHVLDKTFAEISNVPNLDIQALEQSTDSAYINSKLELLRDTFIGAHITTYNYRPGVGLVSMIDSNNNRTYYEYDSFGRLKIVKDNKGNVLQHHSYNYKQN
ncbi:MAG: hypothetical protein KF803_10550 [Cyclobacteriaceae bacterium]|nr:hypothetical protein [Cyclobacteriaceae bacterium]